MVKLQHKIGEGKYLFGEWAESKKDEADLSDILSPFRNLPSFVIRQGLHILHQERVLDRTFVIVSMNEKEKLTQKTEAEMRKKILLTKIIQLILLQVNKTRE